MERRADGEEQIERNIELTLSDPEIRRNVASMRELFHDYDQSNRAVEVVDVTVTVQSNSWALNGDTVRQPMVPLLQKIDTPVIQLTDTAIVNPSRDAVTQLFIG